ncbi:hypothetical protein PAMP_003765 [Pampus punctatissimus]
MSPSPSYQRNTACASPESPKQGDSFFPQQLYDNLQSLEVHETPVLLEFTEVRTLDGRFITLVKTQTQTDWEWAEQRLSFSCQVQKEIEDPQLLQAELSIPKNIKSELEISPDNEALDSLSMETPVACHGETEVTNIDKVWGVRGGWDAIFKQLLSISSSINMN